MVALEQNPQDSAVLAHKPVFLKAEAFTGQRPVKVDFCPGTVFRVQQVQNSTVPAEVALEVSCES
jgi:hypothetical protein